MGQFKLLGSKGGLEGNSNSTQPPEIEVVSSLVLLEKKIFLLTFTPTPAAKDTFGATAKQTGFRFLGEDDIDEEKQVSRARVEKRTERISGKLRTQIPLVRFPKY
ncbi:hypothetical protein R1flu_018298 [Riccia fluitans]|uniref:Uncharacterized protein n=1 Tax=Riccia fluitans TaxID=41844 RepID=A0ABD1ZFQ8_9MARC